MRHKHLSIVNAFSALLIASLLSTVSPYSVYADTARDSKGNLTNELIQESEASKKEAENQKKALNSGLTDVKSLISSLEQSKNDLTAYVEELDADLSDIQTKIDMFGQLITQKEAEVEAAGIELEAAKQVEANQYETMKKRIKFMYEKGDASTAEMLLSSRSFADFLNKAEFINRLSAYDRKMLNSYIASKELCEEKEEALILQQQQLEEARLGAENEQTAMETLMETKEQEIAAYEADISSKEEAVAEYEAMIAEQNQIIKDLEKAIEAERKRLIEENKKVITYDGGMFTWPAPSYTRISDDYGNRIHPTLKTQQFHNGIDMAAPGGSPILAAYDGEVIASSYSSTMGNYCMIDHGDGLITIYMHAQSMSVKEGQTVTKGQQIGKVGTTGRSTGNHLHFSVRKNGSYVSPWSYLGK